jgi:hypothetical protein
MTLQQCILLQPFLLIVPIFQVLKKDRISQKDVAKLLAEKDEIIVDLREEGENLSRQAGKHSEIIKKLRTKEKSLEKELNSTKNSLEEKNKVFLDLRLISVCFDFNPNHQILSLSPLGLYLFHLPLSIMLLLIVTFCFYRNVKD